MLNQHDTRPIPEWVAKPLIKLGIKPHWFWVYVEIKSKKECWVWTGSSVPSESKQSPLGYGRFRYNGRVRLAHRVAHALHNKISIESYRWPDRIIMHTCDNPGCCNPHHLRLGTHLENVQDRKAKGRGSYRRGEGVNTAILTENKVRNIRKKVSEGVSMNSLARKYGVTRAAIYAIVKGVNWAWVT